MARFTHIGHNVYSFGFGDWNESTKKVDDRVISNNGDGDKVLRTAAGIIYDFTAFHMGAAVFIKGSTPARTRTYQMGINKFWDEINPHFEVLGKIKDKWDPFEKGVNYEAFIGRRKASFF